MKISETVRHLAHGLGKYWYLILVLLAGGLLLLLPPFGGEKGDSAAPPREAYCFDVADLEQKLSGTLSEVAGAGSVRVVLTVKAGPRHVLAQDVTTAEREGVREKSTATVVTSKGSSGQEAVALQQVSPTFQGALVVCPGGDEPSVCLKMMEAVSALTGLGADKIVICKGK